jgi:lycopene beta-cyclase
MSSLTQQFSRVPVTRPYVYLIIAWVLTMISLPIAKWTLGSEIIPTMTTISAVFQCAAVFLILQYAWGLPRTAAAFAMVAILTWGMEFLGHTTGFPFGDYDYTELLQPQIGGVPLLIPIAWFMMFGPAWAVAYTLLGGRIETWPRRLAFCGLSTVAITAWDLFLDPQMVGWGFWIWAEPSGYFGIPWVNYFGWLLTGFLATLAVVTVLRPSRLPALPLLIVYGVVWFLQTIGLAVFWSQPGPALVGSVAMGALLLLALRRREALPS